MPVAVNPAPVWRRRRPAAQCDQGTPDTVRCECTSCRGSRAWPSYYVGLWVYIPLRTSRPEDWVVRRIALDCIIEWLEPALDSTTTLPPTTERQAMNEGLSVRDPGKRSIWAPLMSGECEACGELRVTRRRFCLSCQARAVAACREAGWSEETIQAFIAAPVNGRDPFVDSYDIATG